MELPEHIRRRFGSNIPQYVRDWWASRVAAKQQREAEARAAAEAREAEFQRKRALRRPPARVWLVPVGTHGMEVHWEPPETADELAPTGYIVGGDSDSSQLLPPERRKQWLRIYRPGNRITVECDYSAHQITKLCEHSQFTREAEPAANPPPVDEPTQEIPALPVAGFDITVGGSGNSRGFNRILGWGGIDGDGFYTTPTGKQVMINHCRNLRGGLVFSLAGDAALEDFPTRIVATADATAVLVPGAMKAVQGGMRVDYRAESGNVDAVFAARLVRVGLYYDS